MNTARQLARSVADGSISSSEIVRSAIGRIESLDAAINAVVCRDFERALERAARADQLRRLGAPLGPLHGVPITVKDSFHVEGLPTTFGRPEHRHNVAKHNADVVARFIAAGAIILGKTNVPTDLADCQSANALYGVTSNPHDTSRTCGGSSGGSAAALAAGMVPLEMGSDLAGSIRTPAHFCGVYAHKPTYGVVSSRGHQLLMAPRMEADISVVGPMATNAEDLALAFGIVAGPAPTAFRLELPPPRASRLADVRVAVLDSHELGPVGNVTRGALHALVERLRSSGARVEQQPVLPAGLDAFHHDFLVMFRSVSLAGAPQARRDELAAMTFDDGAGYVAAGVKAATLGHAEWIALSNRRESLKLAWQAFFEDFDVLLCPVHPTTAFPHKLDGSRERQRIDVDGVERPYNDHLFWAGIAGYPGLPATVVPIGRDAHGLPIGVQVVGPAFGDLSTLGFATLLDREVGQ